MALHKTLPITEVHTPISFQYANATARTGASGFTSNDLFKFAHQQDNNTIWMLTATTPTWAEVTSTGSGAITNKIDLPAIKNTAGSIGVGKLVYIISHNDPNAAVEVELAQADSETTMGTIGIVVEALDDTTTGTMRIIGKVDSLIDTSAFSVGDELFVSAATAGELTNVKPTGPNKVQHVGRVLKVGASDGIVYVTAVGVVLDLSDADPQNLGSSADSGISPKFSREDHVHLHGFLSHPSHHALATTSAHGFMSSTDKATLDGLGSGNVLVQVRNETGATLTKGTLVAVSGFNLTEDLATVVKADKDTISKSPAIGFVETDIANNANGNVMTAGLLKNIDTSAFSLTDQLVLGNNGAFILPPPSNSPFTGEIQLVGDVARVDATNGHIRVQGSGQETVNADQVFALAGTDGSPGPSNKYVTDSDPRNSDARTPIAHKDSHKSGGGDAFLSTDLLEAVVKRLRESGGQDLLLGTVADGQYLKRSGTGIVGDAPNLRQSVFEEITADTTTTSSTYVDLLTLNITTTAGGILLINMTTSISNTVKDNTVSLQILVDGTPQRGTFTGIPVANQGGSAALVFRITGLSAAAHTIKVQWKTASGTAQIRPVSVDNEHASLLVQEVAV